MWHPVLYNLQVDSCFIYHNTKVTKSLTTNQLVYNNSFLQMQSVCKYPCTLQNVSFDTFGATFDNFSRDNQSLKFFENTLRVLCGYNSWPIWAQKMSKEASWMGLWHLPRKVVALHCWNESHQKFGYFITMKYVLWMHSLELNCMFSCCYWESNMQSYYSILT